MNRLQFEKSPYLLQHAQNPVDWFPWGTQAFEKAKKENKPIFLSIGYSTCHWCHVMEHESFEDETVAKIMNSNFVCIKVDREERPDVDKVYMTAVQMMFGHGGWPLSVFLTPELKPFYGGTYFPPKDMNGRPGFTTVLERISEVWQKENDDIVHSGEELINAMLQQQCVNIETSEISESMLKRTYHQLAASYDVKYGGFGDGTKFPRPVIFNFLFRYYRRKKEDEALKMSLTTLLAMANSGMVDHLGGGFHRYSVDAQWRVPHFEKMLYDQAQLAHSYCDAYQITQDEVFAATARETLDYVLRDMTSSEGGFYSAEDADSIDPKNPGRKTEGAFYVWEKNEIEAVLTPEEAKVFCLYYCVEENGNAFSDPQNEFVKKNILYSPLTIEETAEKCGVTSEVCARLLQNGKKKLFHHRAARRRPHLDDKILTGWNGLMIGAMARGSRVLGEKKYLEAAIASAECIQKNLFHSASQKLYRRYRGGEAKIDAQLDDYAFYISGLLELYFATFDLRWLKFASELQGLQTTLFWDSSGAGFFDTDGKDSSLLVRMKESYDGAEPSGNSVSVLNLLRLAELTGEKQLKDYAEKSLKYFSGLLQQSPQTAPLMMSAVDSYLAAPMHLILAGGKSEAEQFAGAVSKFYLPDLLQILLDKSSKEYFQAKLPFTTLMGNEAEERITAYYCKDYACQLPVKTAEELVTLIQKY